LIIENQKGDRFFGEPALDIKDLMRVDRDGRGTVSIIAADKLMENPRLYATFLLWLLSELFEELPEVGDLDKPKLVFFFDEAHLLFTDAPKALLDAVERVVRLIRSKGVGVYFVTQNPLDIPESVLGQLGNRVQHALRAFTPRDQKAVKSAAETFRQNPKLDVAKVITELGVGEALVSMLEGKGTHEMVERTLIAQPAGRVGPVSADERKAILAASPMRGKYDTTVDRESAFEMLQKRKKDPNAAETPAGTPQQPGTEGQASGGGFLDRVTDVLVGRKGGRASVTERVIVNVLASAARSIGTQLGRAILRGTLGGMVRGAGGGSAASGRSASRSRSSRSSGGDNFSEISDLISGRGSKPRR
jgi:DNA helicase HerA-like ATPase